MSKNDIDTVNLDNVPGAVAKAAHDGQVAAATKFLMARDRFAADVIVNPEQAVENAATVVRLQAEYVEWFRLCHRMASAATKNDAFQSLLTTINDIISELVDVSEYGNKNSTCPYRRANAQMKDEGKANALRKMKAIVAKYPE